MSRTKSFRLLFPKLFVLWAILLGAISVAADMGGLQLVSTLFGGIKHYDVFIHFFLVGSLGFCAALASQESASKHFLSLSRLVWIVLLVSILEETSQLFRELRGFSFADMGANVLGILLFSRLGLLLRRRLLRVEPIGAN